MTSNEQAVKDVVQDIVDHVETMANNIHDATQWWSRESPDEPTYMEEFEAIVEGKITRLLREHESEEIARLKAGLEMIAQIIHGSTRVTHGIALGVLQGGDVRTLEGTEAIIRTKKSMENPDASN